MGKHQARLAGDALLGRQAADREVDVAVGPRVTCTDPQVAAVAGTDLGR